MNRVWERSRQSGGALLVLLALADNADDEGNAFPKMETLADKSRLSLRQTQRAVKQLVKAGELALETGGGRGHENTFRVITLPKKTMTNCHPSSTDEKGDTSDAERVTFLTLKGDICDVVKGDISDIPPTPPYKDDPSFKTNTDPSEDPSDAIASGVDTPSEPPKTAVAGAAKFGMETAAKVAREPEDFSIWNLGVRMLVAGGHSEKNARSFLGKLLQQYGRSRLAQAVTETLAQDAIAPLEYLTKTVEAVTSRERSPVVGAYVPNTPEEDARAEAELKSTIKQIEESRRVAKACQGIELAMKTEKLTFSAAIVRLCEWGVDGPVTERFVEKVIGRMPYEFEDWQLVRQHFPKADAA